MTYFIGFAYYPKMNNSASAKDKRHKDIFSIVVVV